MLKRNSLSCFILTLAFVCTPVARAETLSDEERFDLEVRPILSDKCFACHGPDSATRKADLRLDSATGAYAAAIDQTELARSLLLKRITAEDPDDRMPPADSGLSLSQEEVATISQWVADGAPYARHWAFRPVAKPDPPAPWPVHPVDAFVRKRLKEENLTPSPLADDATLVRRIYLDLTGLPPHPEELDAALATLGAGGYADVVEQLLTSPAFGEHFARQWLDVARYADTYGYQNDRDSNLWPYRDWVIDAYNRNLPYDQFVLQQLAGDLIPLATQDQKLATAFNRLHRQTNEGGSVLEEFRVEYVADRVETYSTAMLGLTVGCARCHDHKFDPILQKDYYAFFAFFDDIDEAGMYSHFTSPIPSPSLPLYKPGQEVEHERLRHSIAEAEQHLAEEEDASRDRLRDWLTKPVEAVEAPKPEISLDFDFAMKGKTPNAGGEKTPATLSQNPKLIEGARGKALLFDGDNSVEVRGAALERTDPFTLAAWIRPAETVGHQVVLHRSKAAEDAASRGYTLSLEDGKPAFMLAHFWPGNAIQTRTMDALPTDTWTHVAITYEGSSRAEGVKIYVNGNFVPTEVIRDNLTRTIGYADGDAPGGLMLGARFRDIGFKDGAIDQLRVYAVAVAPLFISALARHEDPAGALRVALDSRDEDGLLPWYVQTLDAPYQARLKELADLRAEEEKFIDGVPAIMVMEDMAEPRQAHILNRGSYDQHGDPVAPDTPEAILPFPADYPKNRLGLAYWTISPENPLTARVEVNRIWRNFFGEGLVKTQEDFGIQGTRPSHPKLLDYLAATFMESGWDVKALCRLIVSSATYQQSSAYRPELKDIDPENRLLARGPSYRLDAEVIRDSALALSGLLVPTIGGPSVKPVQPPDLWKEAGSLTYVADEGDARHRRSMYTFWKRTVPPPNMLTFDAVNREVCTARRERTTTPLQALVLLNDPQFVEASQQLALHAREKFPDNVAARMNYLFKALAGGTPDAIEAGLLMQTFEEQRAWYAERPEDAVAYAGVKPGAENVVELAATVAVAQALMNFEPFQVRT